MRKDELRHAKLAKDARLHRQRWRVVRPRVPGVWDPREARNTPVREANRGLAVADDSISTVRHGAGC